MATEIELLGKLSTEQTAISTADLAEKVQAGREGTRKQMTRLKAKGHVGGDSQEGWIITEEGKKALGLGVAQPSMIAEGVTPRQMFEQFGQLIGIRQERIALATRIVWSGDHTNMVWVWNALGQADIDVDLKRVWLNSWRAYLHKGIPIELEKDLVETEGKVEVKPGAGPRIEGGRSYILQEDLPVYVGKNLGDLTYEDALDLARIRGGRAARRGDGAPGQQWGPDEILKIVKAVQEFVPSGAAAPKSYVVSRGEEGKAVVQEVEPGKPVVVEQPTSQPGTSYMVNPEGDVKELKPGEPIVVVKQPAAAAPPQKTFIVKQTSEGTTVVEEHDPGKPIIIQAGAPGGVLPAMYPFPAMGADGKPMFDNDGNPIYVNVEPMIKWMGFQREEKRSDERHSALMELTGVIKENLPIGIEAFSRAASEVKGKAPESAAQQYECGNCHKTFTLPRVPGEEEKVICPHCQQEWTGKEVTSA